MTDTPQTPPVQQQTPAQQVSPQKPAGKGLAIAAMVLGIVGAALWCVWFIAIPCVILALIFGILSRKKAVAAGAGTGMATTGIVLGIIGIAIWIILILLFVFSDKKEFHYEWSTESPAPVNQPAE